MVRAALVQAEAKVSSVLFSGPVLRLQRGREAHHVLVFCEHLELCDRHHLGVRAVVVRGHRVGRAPRDGAVRDFAADLQGPVRLGRASLQDRPRLPDDA